MRSSFRAGTILLAAVALLALVRRGNGAPPGTDALVARPMFRVSGAAASPTPTTGYSPQQIRHAYGLDTVSALGAGQVIAVVVAYGSATIQNDLAIFSSAFNLPLTSSTLTIAYPSGPPTSADDAWALETAIDVEWAHALAPGAHILLVVTPTDSSFDMLGGVAYASAYVDPESGRLVQQVSMSWTMPELPGETGMDAQFATRGISYFAAAGDKGAGVGYPAASPHVIGVGGTTLLLTGSGSVVSETAWPESGGGTSVYETVPYWQQRFGSSGRRQVPDVSYSADPSAGFAVYDGTPYQGSAGWLAVGGTSCGAPQWAAIMALANGQRANALASVNAVLYDLAEASYETYFLDITVGSNGTYSAGPGYDEVTGLGSPIASSLVAALSAGDVAKTTLSGTLAVVAVPSAGASATPGALGVLVMSFSLSVGPGEDVNVSRLSLATSGIVGATPTPITAVRLLLNTGGAPDPATGVPLASTNMAVDGTVVFVLAETMAKSTTRTWLVVFDVASGASSGRIGPTFSGLTADGATTGEAITPSGVPLAGDTFTIGARPSASPSGFAGASGHGGSCTVLPRGGSPAGLMPLYVLAAALALRRRRPEHSTVKPIGHGIDEES